MSKEQLDALRHPAPVGGFVPYNDGKDIRRYAVDRAFDYAREERFTGLDDILKNAKLIEDYVSGVVITGTTRSEIGES